MNIFNDKLDLMSEITYIIILLILVVSMALILVYDIKEKKLAKRNEDGTKNKNRGLSIGIVVCFVLAIIFGIVLLAYGNEYTSGGRTFLQVLTSIIGLLIITLLIMVLLKAKNPKFQYENEKAQKMIAILLPFLGALAGLAFGYFTGISDCATELQSLREAVTKNI